MIKSSVYNTVEELARKVNGNHAKELSALQLLCGFAKLVTMDDGVLTALFPKEEERNELTEIKSLLDESQIDLALLKQATPLLLGNADLSADAREMQELLKEMEQDSEIHSASHVLKAIFNENIPELKLCQKGHSLEDVFKYTDKHPVSASKKKKENKSESKREEQSRKEQSQKEQSNQEDKSKEAREEESLADTEDTPTKRERFQILVQKTEQLYDRLMCKVMGQNEAIRMFAQGYFQSEVLQDEESEERKGPSATFLFAGPPGVGKTYLASTASELLKLPFLRIDMSEYSRESDVHRLCGVPKTYAVPKKGVLTEFVDENPRSVVLLDEIEKAHEDVIYQFLQVLDGGTLTDGFTNESVDFTDTILIFTTNVGKSLYEERDRQSLSTLPRAVVLKAIEEEKDEYGTPRFPAAMCSRFASGNLIMFNHLGVHNLLDIVNDRFSNYASKIKNTYDYDVKIDANLAPALLFAQSTGMDARNISAQSIILLKNELYEFGRHVPDLQTSLSKLESMHFVVKYAEDDEQIKELFDNQEVSNILYLGDKKEFEDVPLSEKCKIHYADSKSSVNKFLSEQDVSFVILDPCFGTLDEESDYLSMDDRKTEGVLAFEEIMDKLPQIPVYFIEKEKISKEDKSNFLEKGARGFISFADKLDFSNELAQISSMMYLQKKVDELSGRGRVLGFNTAQRISKDGKKAELIYYDFKIKVAAGAEENRLLLSDNDRPNERFEDVIGAENAKSELEYFVQYMKNPKKYMANSIKPPKGILLYGPPGTGKTMLARAMAGETDSAFFSTTAAGFQDKYVGESERKIRELFKTAKKFAPSIIFIDEIDAIGKERTGSTSTHHTESMLNTLLTEMDGFEVNASKPVFVVAATNYDLDGTKSGKQAKMDPALIRRFDNRIYVDLPNEKEREQFLILQIAKGKNINISQEAIHSIAQRTTGESLATLKNVLELALRNAGKSGDVPNDSHLLNALEEYMYGEKKEWNENYYKSVAIHESGHAYICSLSGEIPSYVTIVSRGDFGGYMQHANEEDTPSYTKSQLLWKIRTSLAGRAAELEFFGENEGINTGISSDLQHATSLAMNMLCRYGMHEDYFLSLSPEKMLNSVCGEELLNNTNQVLKDEMSHTIKLVQEGKDKIEKLANFLLKNNQATEDDIKRIFELSE